MNPLGVRAMYLGSSLYRIHGTDAPWTIGQAVSKGCIRMLNEDVLDLYPRVPVGMKVTVTWQRFNSQMIAGDDEPAPFSPTATASTASYKTPGSVRPIRQRTPSSDAEQVVHNDEAAVIDPNADEATLAAAAEKPIDPKPVKKAEVHKKHEATAATAPPHDAVAIAEKAAAAAAKAAEAARAAADAAKKAAEDAKKATSAESKEPGKSAAL